MITDTPRNQRTFVISFKCDDGQTLEGQFTCKRLSVRDRAKIGARKSQLSGGMYCVRDDDGKPTGQGLDEDTDYLNSMIAHLEISLLQKPQWWDLEKIEDMGLVREVYQKVVEFEMTFFRPQHGEGDSRQPREVGAGNGRAESPTHEPGNTPTEVVGKEVSAALDA